MLIEPNSTIILLSGVPLDPSYENTVYFENTSQQYAYFAGVGSSFGKLVIEDYSYLRKTRNQIKVEMPILNARLYNYMMFRNISFEGKWFYAFITEIEYINNVTALITYSIDLIQTWLCDYDFNQCVIEREHTSTDGVGDHIIEENLETGEFIYNGSRLFTVDPVIVIAVTTVWDSNTNQWRPANGGAVRGKDGNNGIYYFPCAYGLYDPTDNNDLQAINDFIDFYTEKNKINAIISIFMADRRSFELDPVTHEPVGFSDITVPLKTTIGSVSDYYIDGYKVHNKKLMCYPYNFIQVSNLNGDAIDFRWEFFTNVESATFSVWGNRSLNPGLILYSQNYKGLPNNGEEIVAINNFPQCAYNNDTYKAWLAQNRGMISAKSAIAGAQVGMAAVGMFMNPSIVSAGNQVVSALSQTAELMATMHDKSTLPATQHGSANGDLMYQSGLNGFFVSKKSITEDYARRIDGFFTMYGYKVNRVGLPNLHNRACYTFVKTVGCNIKPKTQQGYFEVPADDTLKIEKIYDKGIRFWDKSATFGSFDWDVNNNIPITLGGA